MIKPTIGRIVLYNDGNSDQLIPAIICYVHNDELINISAFDYMGNQFGVIKVKLLSEGRPRIGLAGWMEYQLKQDKKYGGHESETSS